MITATIYKAGLRISGFKIYGHADFAPHGEDIVCAAISMLATTTANSLEVLVSDAVAVQASEEGMIGCRLPEQLDELADIKAQAILGALEIGLKNIRDEYPKYIKLKYQ